MEVFAVLPIFAIGYLGIRLHPVLKWENAFLDGNPLHFKTIQYGLLYFFCGCIILLLAKSFCVPFVTYLTSQLAILQMEFENRLHIAWFITLVIVSFFLPFLHVFLHSLLFRMEHKTLNGEDYALWVWEKITRKKPLDKILYTSFASYFKAKKDPRHPCSYVMLTMANHKVYVGIISMLSYEGHQASDIECKIIPVLSGYRDSETHEVIFTTDYESATKGQHGPLGIALKLHQISAATEFNKDIYSLFQQSKHPSSQYPAMLRYA